MLLNKFDNFTKCEAVIVGKVNHSLLNTVDSAIKDHVQFVFEQTEHTLSNIVNLLESLDVRVHRPKPVQHTSDMRLNTPNMKLRGIKNTICPTDSFAVIADTIVECASPEETAYYDHVQYKHIWQEYFDAGSKWIAAPIPTHDPINWTDQNGNADGEILFDGPAINLCGDKMFVSATDVMNKRAKQWLCQQFPQFEVITVGKTHGHLDAYFSILKPGVIFSALPKQELPSIFNTWEVIQSPESKYVPEEVVDTFLQDDDYENTTLEVTGFSIDEQHYMMAKHMWQHHPEIVKQIESHKINCIPVEHSATRWLGQGLCCMVNSIARKGKMENYF